MYSSTILSFAALAVLPQALATVFVTNPVATTTCNGGSPCTIAWQDDGTAPSLATFAVATVGLYVGNQQQQTLLQSIQSAVNVATTAGIQFTPDPSVGPNGNAYFIKFISASAKDPTNAANPAEAFSAKFTLANMSGQFNASVSSEIQGVTTAGSIPTPGAPASTTPGSSTASTGASSATSKPTSAASSGTSKAASSASSTSSAAKTSQSSGAGHVVISGFAGFAGVVATIFALAL